MNIPVETPGKYLQTMKDIPSTVYVISAQEINRYGYDSILQALASLPGISTQKNWFLDRLIVRGQKRTFDQFLLLIDGQSMAMKGDDYSILNHSSPIDMNDIERMEVILGPNSTLYGSGAFSGVINVFTKNHQGLTAKVASSSANEHKAHLGFGKQFGDKQFSMSLAATDHAGDELDYTFPNGAPTNNSLLSGTEDGFNAITAERFSTKLEGANFSLQARFSHSKLLWPATVWRSDFHNKNNFYEIDHTSLQAKHLHELGEKAPASFRLYYNDANGKWSGSENNLVAIENYGGQYYGAEYKVDLQVSESLSVISGLEVTDNFDVYSVDEKSSFTNSSIFSMVNYHINPDWLLNIGGRLEQYSINNRIEFMPQLGAVYHYNQHHHISANYSRGFLNPSAWANQVADTLNSKELEPEINHAYEVNYKYNSDNWQHHVTAYQIRHVDQVEVSGSGTEPQDFAYNSSYDKVATGFDLSSRLHLKNNLSSMLGMSYVDSKERDISTGKKINVSGISDYVYYLQVNKELDDHSNISLQANHASEPSGYDDIGTWTQFSISYLNEHFYGSELAVKVTNLFDEDLKTYVVSNASDGIPDQGRTLHISLKQQFF